MKRTYLKKYFGFVFIILMIYSCKNLCNDDSAILKFKTKAIYGLGKPDTIWFPSDNINLIKDGGIWRNIYTGKFISYGKEYYYVKYYTDFTIICKSGEWRVIRDESYLTIIEDKFTIDSLKAIQPTYTSLPSYAD